MQPVEKKRKRTWKHGRGLSVAAAFVLFGVILAAFLLWPRTETKEADQTPVPVSAGSETSGSETVPDGLPETPETGDSTLTAAPEKAETGNDDESRTEADQPEMTRGTLLTRQEDELEAVTVSVRGQEPWTVIRDEAGDMHLKGSEGWTVKERLAEQIRSAMSILAYEYVITEDPAEYRDRLADFGLDDPFIVAEVRFTDGKELVIRLGNEIPVEESVRYMTVDGDDRLYAVSHSLAEDLDIEKEALHPVTQPEIYPVLLDRVTVYGKDGKEQAEWRLRGDITDQDAGMNWEITAPVRYCADETTIQNMKTSAGNLRMGVFLDDATEERLAEYGLAEPEYTLELHMAGGSTGTVSDLGV